MISHYWLVEQLSSCGGGGSGDGGGRMVEEAAVGMVEEAAVNNSICSFRVVLALLPYTPYPITTWI